MPKNPKNILKERLSRKYKAHDPENRLKVGDKAKIVETKPRSKGKKWEVIYETKN